jgi:hypothetical protein
VISRQGRALKVDGRKRHIKQFFCLRHFIETLKDPNLSVQIGNLVKYGTAEEFDQICRLSEPGLRELIGPEWAVAGGRQGGVQEGWFGAGEASRGCYQSTRSRTVGTGFATGTSDSRAAVMYKFLGGCPRGAE